MKFNVLDTVVLLRNVPEHGLERGDLGAIVELYEPDHAEVEFVLASGYTKALVTLALADIRTLHGSDMPSVREVGSAHSVGGTV